MHQDSSSEIEADIELRLQRRPLDLDTENLRSLMQQNGIQLTNPIEFQDSIKGKWAKYGHDDTVELTITASDEGYDVLFDTCGDLAQWRLHRTAVVDNGTLLLNRPVVEYCPRRFDRYYAITNPPKMCLVSQVDVRNYWSFYLRCFERGELQGTPEGLVEYLWGQGLERV